MAITKPAISIITLLVTKSHYYFLQLAYKQRFYRSSKPADNRNENPIAVKLFRQHTAGVKNVTWFQKEKEALASLKVQLTVMKYRLKTPVMRITALSVTPEMQ